ncbi:uncharacterized protein LOC62_02G001998 [Vanrija pseudolonga]|uniref:Uncharacterized protein n=1 Tax=Vanrija pseudolonga TaxID=143232 RepID=A0AAF1BI85_9TREE|nr:hypothetical protein LOC62_02G001998 [Vanrija pseudolonga]
MSDADKATIRRAHFDLEQVPGFNRHGNLYIKYRSFNTREYRYYKYELPPTVITHTTAAGTVETAVKSGSLERCGPTTATGAMSIMNTRDTPYSPFLSHDPRRVRPIAVPTYVKFLFNWNQKHHASLGTLPLPLSSPQRHTPSRFDPVETPDIDTVGELLALADEWAENPARFWVQHRWNRFRSPAQARPQTPYRSRITFEPATPEDEDEEESGVDELVDEMSHLVVGTGEQQAEVNAFTAEVEATFPPPGQPNALTEESFVFVPVPGSEAGGTQGGDGSPAVVDTANADPYVVVAATDGEAEGSSGGDVAGGATDPGSGATQTTEEEEEAVLVETEEEGGVGEPGAVEEEAAPVIVEAEDAVPEAGEAENAGQVYQIPSHGVSSVSGRLLNAMRVATPALQAMSNWVRSSSAPSRPIIDEARTALRELSEVLNTLKELLHDPATGYPYPTTPRRR